MAEEGEDVQTLGDLESVVLDEGVDLAGIDAVDAAEDSRDWTILSTLALTVASILLVVLLFVVDLPETVVMAVCVVVAVASLVFSVVSSAACDRQVRDARRLAARRAREVEAEIDTLRDLHLRTVAQLHRELGGSITEAPHA